MPRSERYRPIEDADCPAYRHVRTAFFVFFSVPVFWPTTDAKAFLPDRPACDAGPCSGSARFPRCFQESVADQRQGVIEIVGLNVNDDLHILTLRWLGVSSDLPGVRIPFH